MHAAPPASAPKSALFLLAICAGLGVANVYYLQPSLSLVQSEFGATAEQAGWLPAATQLSYAIGMLLLAPLGDMVQRRRLILVKTGLLAIALVLAWMAPSLNVLILASALVGLLASVGQDFVPAAANLVPEKARGRAVGTVTMGLLSGILLSRTLGGWVSVTFGWREMQLLAAVLMVVVMAITAFAVPSTAPSHRSNYRSLLASLWAFWGRYRELRLAVIVQALLAATLGAFWSCLAMVLAAPPFHLGAGVAGSFGIAGVVGALAAPLFGRLADHRGPLLAIRAGCGLVIVAFVGMALSPMSLWGLAIGAVLFDLGVTAGFVSHQTLVNGLNPNARSRLNGLLMTGSMLGMAVGATIGNFAWAHAGKTGLFGFTALAGIAALAISFLHHPFGKTKHVHACQ